METPDDIDEIRTFYDPHPGLAGASIPIPAPIKTIADELNGARMSLRSAIARLERAEIGLIEVVPQHKYIALRLGGMGAGSHFFRVIRFR